MKRPRTLILFLGTIVAGACLLFPNWQWTQPAPRDSPTRDTDSDIDRSEWAFVGSSPTRTAHIDWDTLLFQEWGILMLTAGALYVFQSRKRDREVGAIWQAKWESTTDQGNTLLRASSEPTLPSQTLLRAATGTTPGQADQMLRASQPREPLEGVTNTGSADLASMRVVGDRAENSSPPVETNVLRGGG